MLKFTANLPAATAINRVLNDYPMARERLCTHAGARIDVSMGPLNFAVRISQTGGVEPVGEGADDMAAVTFNVPLAVLPRLLQKDETAFHQIKFDGDSELAQLLSVIAGNVEWDIEEDLSKLFGGGRIADIAAHRVVGTVQSLAAWGDDAKQRFTENIAEYLVHERHAFIITHDLEMFARENEAMRNDVARLDARINLLMANLPAKTLIQ